MTVAELIAALLSHPYNQPVEIETADGDRIEIIGTERISHGVRLLMTDVVCPDYRLDIAELEAEVVRLEGLMDERDATITDLTKHNTDMLAAITKAQDTLR